MERLAEWCAADLQPLLQVPLAQRRTGRQGERDDQLLERDIGALREGQFVIVCRVEQPQFSHGSVSPINSGTLDVSI